TIAHWALKENRRGQLLLFLGLTILLGVTFLACQAYEYAHAYSELNLKLSTGAYGSTFFMLTGFHGFHVTCGAIMLTVIWFRCLRRVRPARQLAGTPRRGETRARRRARTLAPIAPSGYFHRA